MNDAITEARNALCRIHPEQYQCLVHKYEREIERYGGILQ